VDVPLHIKHVIVEFHFSHLSIVDPIFLYIFSLVINNHPRIQWSTPDYNPNCC